MLTTDGKLLVNLTQMVLNEEPRKSQEMTQKRMKKKLDNGGSGMPQLSVDLKWDKPLAHRHTMCCKFQSEKASEE